jgi:hypothetical protein
VSYNLGPAGHYHTRPPFDDAVPLERQLRVRHGHREVSAAYLPYEGLGEIGNRAVLDALRAQDEHDLAHGLIDPALNRWVHRERPDIYGPDPMGVVDGEWDWLDQPMLMHVLMKDGSCHEVWDQGGGLGDVSAWNYPTFHTLDANEVYVVRLKCTGLPLSDGKDLLLFVRALGITQTLGFDIRGAAAWQDVGADQNSWWIDLVATVPGWEGNPIPLLGNDAASIAAKIQNDPTLRQAFPSLQIDQSASLWGELTGPAQSIDFWKSQPLLWDHTLPGPKCVALIGGCGGPTNTFPSPPASSIVKGKADDGAMATPFPVSGSVPITTPDTQKGYALGDLHVAGVLAIAGALGLGYYYYYGRKGAGR